MTLAQRDLARLDDETRATWETLAALREGRVIREFAHHLIAVTNAVIDMHTMSESGKIGGPTGSVTLTIQVGPSQEDPTGAVVFTDKIQPKRPEDRTTAVYVGRGGVVHVRPPNEMRNRQMALVNTEDVAPSLATAAEEAPDEDDTDGAPRPYKD